MMCNCIVVAEYNYIQADMQPTAFSSGRDRFVSHQKQVAILNNLVRFIILDTLAFLSGCSLNSRLHHKSSCPLKHLYHSRMATPATSFCTPNIILTVYNSVSA